MKNYMYTLHVGDKVVDKGNANYISQKYNIDPKTIHSDYLNNNKLKGLYTLTREEYQKIYTIYVNGKELVGTFNELMEMTGFSKTTISKYIQKEKKKDNKRKVQEIIEKDINKELLQELDRYGQIVVRPYVAEELIQILGKGYTFENREAVACKERFMNICIKRA